MTQDTVIDIETIMEYLPHRYPLLLVDRVIDFFPEKGLIALKNVTFNEPHFTGHFPGKPIMPGVLIIEAMAQASGIFVLHSTEDNIQNKLVYFMSIDSAKFRKPVVPGDTLHIHVEKIQNRGNVWKFKTEAKVNDQKVAEAVVSAMITDK